MLTTIFRVMFVGGFACWLLLDGVSVARAQEPDMTLPPPVDSAVPETVAETPSDVSTTKSQTHVAIYGLGTNPMDEKLKVGSASVSNAELKRGFGGGIKVGAFPKAGKGIFGVEGELFGFGGGIKAPNTGLSGADGSLVAVNTMINVLLRYPGSYLQPYIGAGGGVSLGFLDANAIQAGGLGVTGKSGQSSLAFQLLGGLRAYVSDKAFLFGEYKYFGTKYQWESEGAGNPELSLSIRAHIIAAGFGFSF